MTKEQEILTTLKQWMNELFEIEPEKITLSSHLFDDLDIDSIDAIDLVVKIRDETGVQVKPEQFREVRYVKDIVAIMKNF